MLSGGEEDAVLHQAGGVAHARDVVALRFYREIIEVDAAKDDAGVGGGWDQADVPVDPGVQANAFCGSRLRDGCLEHL
jgi:hypothetical protein